MLRPRSSAQCCIPLAFRAIVPERRSRSSSSRKAFTQGRTSGSGQRGLERSRCSESGICVRPRSRLPATVSARARRSTEADERRSPTRRLVFSRSLARFLQDSPRTSLKSSLHRIGRSRCRCGLPFPRPRCIYGPVDPHRHARLQECGQHPPTVLPSGSSPEV